MRNPLPLLLLAIAAPSVAADRPVGTETVITYAGGGGLRDWQAGPARSGVVYVRDRTLRWYRVTLTGACTTDTALDRLTYTTDTNGVFDRFSTVSVGRYPDRTCGVASIRTSLPPPGQPGAPKPLR